MSWRFNPPPGWPAQPVGWSPPPGWSPDPSWPPAPPDWQFWVPATRPTPWYRRWWAVTGVLFIVLLVGFLAGAGATRFIELGGGTATPGPDPTAPVPPAPASPAEPRGLQVGVEQTGRGPRIVPLDLPSDAKHTITVSYTGEGFFSARFVDDNGDYASRMDSGSGDYTGIFLVETAGDPPAAVDISRAGDGTWSLLVNELAVAPLWPEQTEGTGTVVLRIDPEGVDFPTVVTADHDGDSNFMVWAYTDERLGEHMIFNEIGELAGAEGQRELTEEMFAIQVRTDSSWRLVPGSAG